MQGLTVQGVSPYRLTPVPEQNITVPDEVGQAIVARNLVRRFTESKTAIAMAGLGVRPVALTVRAHVRATLTMSVLALWVASLQEKPLHVTLTPKPVPRSDECPHYGGSRDDCGLCSRWDEGHTIEVEL